MLRLLLASAFLTLGLPALGSPLPEAPAQQITEQPANHTATQDPASQGKATIRMATIGGLRYEFAKFYVKPGVDLELIVDNKDEMMHNLVITQPGARMKVVQQAMALGVKAAELNYIPKTADVLWSIGVLKPGESSTLRFKTPKTEGDYPYVCTYPGHGFVMFGTMVVTKHPKPAERSQAAGTEHQHHSHHSGSVTLKRMFMPSSGPASIAVSQPDGRSYCWDAGACRLRYAWAGGPITKVKMGKAPQLTGPVIYRASAGFPLKTGKGTNEKTPSSTETARFLGYRLDSLGNPEFAYRIGKIEIRERVEIKADKIVRSFVTNTTDTPIRFRFDTGQAPQAKPHAEIVQAQNTEISFFRFTPEQSKAFSITHSLSAGQGAAK